MDMGGAGLKVGILMMMIVVFVGGGGNKYLVGGEVHHHHVDVGSSTDDPAASDLATWSSSRIFTVGDHIWFRYSAGQGHDDDDSRMVEVKSMEEYLSCDVSNPIKMYTDTDRVVFLEEEGIRYFLPSANVNGCKQGMKLRVDVQPQPLAAAPTSSSSPTHHLPPILFVAFFLSLFLY